MSKPFLVSDQTINSYRCRVLNTGGDTSAFESNPVMLWMHQRGVVIGKWINLTIEGDQIFATPVFDLEDNGKGAEIGGKVEREFLKAASMGIVILEAMYNEVLDCYDITKWYLQEISIVDIGSNHNALQLYDRSGEPIAELNLAAHLEQFKPAPTEETTPSPTISTQTPMSEVAKSMTLVSLSLAFGLEGEATEEQIMTLATKGKSAIKELEELKLTIDNNRKSEANQLVQEAIDDKRISATAKDSYLKLFAADHESAKTVLAGLPKPQNLTSINTSTQSLNLAAQTKEQLVELYKKMDKDGSLLKLKADNYTEFERLFEARWDRKPTK